jgi:hypothetical protein
MATQAGHGGGVGPTLGEDLLSLRIRINPAIRVGIHTTVAIALIQDNIPKVFWFMTIISDPAIDTEGLTLRTLKRK